MILPTTALRSGSLWKILGVVLQWKGNENRTGAYMSNFERDLTSGSVMRQLIVFALPFMASNLIQSLYNIADMLIVGRFVGKVGISGVNIGGQITFVMTNIAISICTAGTIIIGQYIGARDRQNASRTIATLFSFLLLLAVGMAVLMLLFDDMILQIIQTPTESYRYAKDYLSITVLGAVFIFGYNALSGIMRGLGNSKAPLYLVAGACIINVVLDLILVGALGMEVRGAAIATIISQAFSMIACIVFLSRSDFMFDFRLSSFQIVGDKLKLILSTGLPIIITNVATNLSFLAMTGLANSLGVTSSAALGVVARYNGFAILPSIAVGASVAAMSAQNIGAGQPERAKQTMLSGIIISYAVSIPIFLITEPFAPHFIAFFDRDARLIQSGVEYLRFFSIEYIIVPLFFALNGLITGSGHTIVSSVIGISSSLLIRLPLAFLFVNVFRIGLAGVGLSAPIASGLATAVALIYFFSGAWKKPVIIKKSAEDVSNPEKVDKTR